MKPSGDDGYTDVRLEQLRLENAQLRKQIDERSARTEQPAASVAHEKFEAVTAGYHVWLKVNAAYSADHPNRCAVIDHAVGMIQASPCALLLHNGVCPVHGEVRAHKSQN